ncbi:MAG: phosphoesterase [Helicobacteraceae bacterium]|jgi:oligoribonuclease NrnB/cAMP/cGMP phosphodiesterase (DHH superfamily)|nr:phosphoesterase [Helicobacteraceae bacterium]
MRVFHLSHNDLDGYSAQLVVKRFFDQTHCFNSSYGAEVTAKLAMIESAIEGFSRFYAKEEKLLLITDLNITREECKLAQSIAKRQDASLQLLDHHKSGEKQADEFKWYFLDIDRSATKITFDWCLERAPKREMADDALFTEYVECVNVYDLWKVDEVKRFEFGKVLNRLLSDAREISQLLFGDKDNDYRLSLLNGAFAFIDDHRYIELDDQALMIKKRYLSNDKARDTIDNLVASFVVDLLLKRRENFTVHYGEYKGLLTYQIGNSSVIGNKFLTMCEDYHFFMDVNKSGSVSLRANNKLDVSVMAGKLFNGGGHANAAGGRITGFKEVFTYEQLRDRVKPLLDV